MSTRSGWTYARAGVDRSKIHDLHKLALRAVSTRPRKWGAYAGTVRYSGITIAGHVDGVGTKALLARDPEDYRVIGIDAVAMNVNDMICVGARPIAVLDYIGLPKPSTEIVENVISGISHACKAVGAKLIGGETAILPDIYANERCIDVIAFVIGVKGRYSRSLNRIGAGDVAIGVASSGLHSNGFSLVRKLLLEEKGYKLDDFVDRLGRPLTDELMRATKIYTRLVESLMRRGPRPTAIAHITGGGYTKLMRLVEGKGLKIVLDSMPEPPAVFKFIQEEGEIADPEMYKTFNMGVGLVMTFRDEDLDAALKGIRRAGEVGWHIGRVERGRGVYVKGMRLDR
ncbi:MAG: phosphoribosylformylglycinamidine cyclo-ligase [Aigarchaeota archaeon]|nr:phosphoribosylformylglycinamidine cyclo-ligase [Aigarchaeota archaeon]MDW8092724.1 phosphoribosylformylglycinamidine cyclo-ligase [Nitrososphaerota archaeon]